MHGETVKCNKVDILKVRANTVQSRNWSIGQIKIWNLSLRFCCAACLSDILINWRGTVFVFIPLSATSNLGFFSFLIHIWIFLDGTYKLCNRNNYSGVNVILMQQSLCAGVVIVGCCGSGINASLMHIPCSHRIGPRLPPCHNFSHGCFVGIYAAQTIAAPKKWHSLTQQRNASKQGSVTSPIIFTPHDL